MRAHATQAAERPTLLYEVGIAALGAGLLALPILEAIGIKYDAILARALGDGVAAIPAVVAGYGIFGWQCAVQIGVGFAIALAPFFLRPYAAGKVDWVALFVGPPDSYAGIEVECWRDAAKRSQPSGLACALTDPQPRGRGSYSPPNADTAACSRRNRGTNHSA